MAISFNQWQSQHEAAHLRVMREAISGNQWQSVAITARVCAPACNEGGHQWPSVSIGGHRCPSVAITPRVCAPRVATWWAAQATRRVARSRPRPDSDPPDSAPASGADGRASSPSEIGDTSSGAARPAIREVENAVWTSTPPRPSGAVWRARCPSTRPYFESTRVPSASRSAPSTTLRGT